MKLVKFIFFLLILNACHQEAPNLSVDHFNIWVKNPIIAKQKLEDIGFKAVPDSLSQIHTGQGTTGRFFYFLNGYLELIYIYDQEEFLKNAQSNKSLDFLERSNSPENGYLPFSICLKMNDYDKNKIPFKTVEYHQEWMGQTNRIYVAQDSKVKKEEPSLFVIFPESEYDQFEHMDSLIKIPEQYSIWRTFYKHKNGAEKISKIKIYSSDIDKTSNTVKTINDIENIEITEGEEYLMELYFDNQRQQKSYDLRPDLPLKIYL